jgi:hypothetical protein
VERRGVGLKAHLIAATGRIVSSRSEGRLPEAVAGAAEAHHALRSAESDELTPLKSTLPHLTIQWSRAMEVGDHPAAIELYEDTFETALLFDQPDVREVIRALKPDVHVKGTDYTPESIPERAEVEGYGGRVAVAGDPPAPAVLGPALSPAPPPPPSSSSSSSSSRLITLLLELFPFLLLHAAAARALSTGSLMMKTSESSAP